MEFTALKAKVAAVGATLTALAVAWATVQGALADGKLDASEVTPLIVAGVTLVATVYGVWRAPNKIKSSVGQGGPN